MEVNKTEPDLSRDEILLDEPHFDEESTILSARPVVPLEVVEAKSRSVRNIFIGSAIVVALFIGAFAATFVYKLRAEQEASDITANDSAGQNQPSLESGVAAIESQDPEPVVEAQEPEATALDRNQPDQRAVVKNVPATSPPLISRAPAPRTVRNGTKPRKQDEPLEEELASQRELNQEIRRAERREQRREERREERRARRVEEAKHQRGDRNSRATDDLSRIREIFEGRPKP
ncbi:MAG TPA: hypothetical protein VEW46_20880 [Pyrinomonadaceae bacterium]|nr:hypothetical protein [Pyrinomonadaceae bacterium]